MNIPVFLAFLRWSYECGGCDSILEKYQVIILRSVEMIAQLHFLTIYQLAIVIPHCWLSANHGSLSEWNFGVADMPWTANLLDDVYGSILSSLENTLNEEFMMNIFQPIATKVPPFQDFLIYMFEEKSSNPIGC